MGGDLLPFLFMVIITVGHAAVDIIAKLAMDSGMNPLVHVAYRQFFATAIMAPFAYFLERVKLEGLKQLIVEVEAL
ncbi:hypothetical protein Vadar_033842 [Vaccinium darrowii]|uniref:Uncharacterized protein n=1 Tax=Vaccinium darrowii TaxID=229202 RepID=A0ACB7ZNA4_9ERIC|nr:hypothetical protein Vadar_033842 [Vaccinium darrowii]